MKSDRHNEREPRRCVVWSFESSLWIKRPTLELLRRMYQTVHLAGRGVERQLQRDITAQREQVARDDLHRDIMQLPHGDTRREAWFACDAFSCAWVYSFPTERDYLSSQELREVFTNHLPRP